MTRKIVSIGRGRWQLLTLPVLLGAQLAAFGQGSTIFHQQFATPNPNPLFPWDFQGQRVMGGPTVSVQWGLDMNLDGQTDFTFVSHEGESFKVVPDGNNAVLSYTYGPGGLNRWALPLSSLSPISRDPGNYSWAQRIDSPFGPLGSAFVAYTSELSIGTFLGVESAYIGLILILDDRVHLGWARVGCPVIGLGGGWIYEAAYDIRPNTAIFAGATSVVIPLAAPEIIRPGQLRLQWPSDIGAAYQVQFKEQLNAPMWSNLNFTVIATATNSAVDVPISGVARFYRVALAD